MKERAIAPPLAEQVMLQQDHLPVQLRHHQVVAALAPLLQDQAVPQQQDLLLPAHIHHHRVAVVHREDRQVVAALAVIVALVAPRLLPIPTRRRQVAAVPAGLAVLQVHIRHHHRVVAHQEDRQVAAVALVLVLGAVLPAALTQVVLRVPVPAVPVQAGLHPVVAAHQEDHPAADADNDYDTFKYFIYKTG